MRAHVVGNVRRKSKRGRSSFFSSRRFTASPAQQSSPVPVGAHDFAAPVDRRPDEGRFRP